MKVKCIGLDSLDLDKPEMYPWLTVGRIYLVTGLHSYRSEGPDLQVTTDSAGDIGWFPATHFVTVDQHIPDSWQCEVRGAGLVTLGPARWLEPGFWEAYYDGDPDARVIYEEELALMQASGDV